MGQREPKVNVSARLATPGVEWLDKVAAEHRTDRTAVIAAAMIIARRHQSELDDLIELRA